MKFSSGRLRLMAEGRNSSYLYSEDTIPPEWNISEPLSVLVRSGNIRLSWKQVNDGMKVLWATKFGARTIAENRFPAYLFHHDFDVDRSSRRVWNFLPVLHSRLRSGRQ